MTSVRAATSADAHALARLRYDFRAAINEPTEDHASFVARCAYWMALRLEPESAWHCWVLEQEGSVVGQLWLQVIEKIPNPAAELEQHAYITNVYVRPESRGSGAGQQLLEAALHYCRAARIDAVILWPTERSRTLYARNGFAVPADLLELSLDSNRHF